MESNFPVNASQWYHSVVNFVSAGGGVVTGEWIVWSIGAAGAHSGLEPIIPVTYAGSYITNTTTPNTHTQATADSVLNNGLSYCFSFYMDNLGGSESCLTTKSSASTFYTSDHGGSYCPSGNTGAACWNYASGRVISFSTLISSLELSDPYYTTLFVNSVEWAGKW
ncbi:MAG: hypothetical protein D6734_07650 [Candidatus Schekmanbacteria bacterium]|nr:MAG: hypothetical protein D6734_07650 [Candidatus Schekmanbacteria bacterium]